MNDSAAAAADTSTGRRGRCSVLMAIASRGEGLPGAEQIMLRHERSFLERDVQRVDHAGQMPEQGQQDREKELAP